MVVMYLLITVFVLILIHWMSQFIFQSWGALPRFLLAFIFSACMLGLALNTEALSLREVCAILVWFFFLSELYVFIFTLSLGSISIKILQLLSARPLAVNELEALYPPASMVSVRFKRLSSAGFIDGSGGILKLTKKGNHLLAIFFFIRGIMHPSYRLLLGKKENIKL